MKESIRDIQQNGCVKSLLQLAKQRRMQQSCVDLLKKQHEYTALLLCSTDDECFSHEGIVAVTGSILAELSEERVVEVT